MADIIYLVTEHETRNEYGDPEITLTKRDVFADMQSIGEKEFYQAHAVGLQPEIKFKLTDYLDYAGEKLVEYEGELFRVLRTYRPKNTTELELTVYREVNQNERT